MQPTMQQTTQPGTFSGNCTEVGWLVTFNFMLSCTMKWTCTPFYCAQVRKILTLACPDDQPLWFLETNTFVMLGVIQTRLY